MSLATTPTSQKKLFNKKANEFAFKSELCGPISELSVLRQSLLFAEISMVSYLSIDECNIAAGKLGFTDGKCFEFDDCVAYWFQNEHDSVVVFRGIEARDWNDICDDAKTATAPAETVGMVHSGFKATADGIWPQIELELEKNNKPLWFCGHSRGGAMAKICADRCMLSYIKSEPIALFTYGSPRVGCKRYINQIDLDHYRWINSNDLATRVPPVSMGYRHSGHEKYLDRLGRLKELNGWRGLRHRLQTFFAGVGQNKRGPLVDHSVVNYVDNIFHVVRTKEPKTGTPKAGEKNESVSPTTNGIQQTGIDPADPAVPVGNKKQLSA